MNRRAYIFHPVAYSSKLFRANIKFKQKSSNITAQESDTTNTGRFIMFSVITNIYNKKTKGPTLMELFTATGKLKKF
jgi:hypothetical protein